MEKLSYALGLGVGRQLAQMGTNDLNVDSFAEAIKDVLAGNQLKISNHEAQKIVEEYFAKKKAEMEAQARAEAARSTTYERGCQIPFLHPL